MKKSVNPRLKIIRRLGSLIPGLAKVEGDLRRPYPPGQHGATRRSKIFDYSLRLREKQKLRFNYGLSEKKMISYAKRAFRIKGNHGLALLCMLENRLDNIIFRAGFASSVKSARQLITHGHVVVNKKKVDIPSFNVKVGDTLDVAASSKMKSQIHLRVKELDQNKFPSYLSKSSHGTSVTKIKPPVRKDILIIINEQLIVEFYAGL
jgi:small subunit ribosomal protein S4